MAAHSTRDWLSNDTVVVLRFIGTTPFSTTLRPLLYSISSQITQVYGDETPVSEDLRDLTKDLKQRLENATPQMPLVLFLDSLDQFDSDDGAHQLLWLPTTLPDNVRLVVSTLVDDKYECYPTLKANLWNDDIFLEVPKMKNDDVKVILTKWLSSRNRTLTEAQTNVLIGAFQKCPLPLFLKISFDVACQWASYTNPQQTIIYQAIYREATNESDSPVRRVISALFETVERSHGEMLVSRALSYITAGRSGLTENELEDVLSCDDDVLNDVFQYWTPPIRRLPPLLWIRVRADLAPYFVERGADGARVLYWYHRQFTEAARDRYLRDHHPKSLIHANLSDYFMGAWANGNKKPYKTRDGTTGEKDRLVAAQPLVFDEHTYNIRKMNELPFHLIRSNQQDKLETQVLCNFTWLLTKMTATSVRRVIDDFKFARSIYPGNEKINTVAELLQLAHHALEKNPDQLASQIVGRISSFDGLEDLLNNARNPHKPCLLPTTAFLTRPGGMLVHSLAGHTHRIYALDIAESGKYALTGSFDATVKLWDIEEGVLLKNMENVGETIQTIRFCKHDDMFVLSALDFGQSYVKVFKTETMTLLKSFETTSGYPTAFAIAKGGSHLIIPEQCELEVIDLNTLTISQKIVDEFLNAMGASATVEARGDIVAYFLTQDFDRKHVRVADLSKPDLPKTTVEVIFEEKYDKRYSATIGGIALIPNKLVVCNQTRSIFHIYSNYGETLTKVIVDLDGITGAHGAAASFCTTFDGRYILVTRFDKVVVWDLEKETKAVMLEHPYFIYRIASRDMSRVVSTSPDKLVRVWDITRGKMAVHVTHQEPRCMGEAPEEIRQLLCPAGYDQLVTMSVGSMVNGRSIVTLWDLGTSRPLSKLKAVSSKPVFWKMLNASTAIASVDKTLKLVNVLKGCIILTFQGKIPNHTTWLAVIEDNRKLMTLSEDQTLVNIYDMSDGTICDVLTHANSAVISDFRVNDNGDGNILVTQLRSQYDCVHIWDLETRQIRHSIRIDNKLGKVALDNSAISSDGMYLSLITYGKSRKKGLLVWNLKTGKQVYHHRKDDTSVLDIVAVENGKLVVQYSDKSICLLNLSTGSLVTELRGHYEFISQFEVTKDNRRIMAFSDRERKLAVWSCDDGTCLGSFTLEKKSKVQLACEGQIIVVLDVYGLTPPILLRVHGQGYTPFPLPDENTDADNEEVDVTMTLQEKVTVLKLWEECAE
uniref:Uncharacterized protein LOC100378314 n=1 Tax=Saccoglossus kowalevskii TaxID=10224 RepID=A0ABM0GPH1_SACKO|nr:PREDICTED: uncharacterized protein LOC100378314 [Saccoglossus kowalevskii]